MKRIILLLSLFLLFCGLNAQFSNSALTPTLLAGGAGEQVIPKIAICDNGNMYLARFDNLNGSYEVWMQYLDSSGNHLWQNPRGILVSNFPQMTWLTEWDLDVDSSGNAWLTFQDIRTAGANNIMLYKVDSDGNILLSPNGIALSDDISADFSNLSPILLCHSSGDVYVAWQRLALTNEIHIQKISTSGELLWGTNGLTFAGDAISFTWPQLLDSGDGNLLLKYYIDSGPFWAPNRQIFVTKLSPQGTTIWNVAINNVCGLPAWEQIIPFVSDGNGGAVLAWYDDRYNDLINEVYMARVNSSGTVTTSENGTLISTDTFNQQYYPKLAVDTVNEKVFAWYRTTDPDQNNIGLARQLMDYSGNRYWGDTGVQIIAQGNSYSEPVAAYFYQDTAYGIYSLAANPGDSYNEHLKVNAVKSDQSSPWSADIFLDSVGNPKLHFDLDVANTGWCVLAYEEGVNYDIYAMRVNPDGTLGGAYYPAPQFLNGYVDAQGTVYLSWQAPSISPDNYFVYVDEELYTTLPAETTSCSISDLTPGTYSFYVCAFYSPDHISSPSNIITLTIIPNAVEDENQNPAFLQLEVKPNPIRNSFTISYFQDKSPAKLVVYNIRGQKVCEQTFTGGAYGIVSQNLNLNLPNGVYLLQLNSRNQSRQKKITIIK